MQVKLCASRLVRALLWEQAEPAGPAEPDWLPGCHSSLPPNGPMRTPSLPLVSARSPLGLGPLAASVIALLVMGCGGAPPPPAAAVASPPPTSVPPPSQPSAAPAQTTTVAISDEIRTKCGISERDAYFAFDSSRITSQDHNALDGVARCFSSGPLKGRHVTLIGHADPRGEAEYNVTLGLSRADAVERYLLGHGIGPATAKTTSRGSMDATGTDEASWEKDRRVDVTLGD